MERYCEICGGGCRRKNGKTVCVRCGYPVKERPLSVAAPLSEAYALLRAQDFSSAQRQFLALLSQNPADPELYWAVMLCRYGIVYERQGDFVFPACYILRRRGIFDDPYFRRALSHARGFLYAYFKAEAVHLENARRNAARIIDENGEGPVRYYAYEELDDIVFERDVQAAKRRLFGTSALVVTALVAISCGAVALIADYVKNRPEPAPSTQWFLVAQWTDTPDVYSGESPERLKDSLSVALSSQGGESVPLEEYAISGELKAGKSTVTISYESYRLDITVNVLGKDGTEGLVYVSVDGGYAVSGYRGASVDIVIPRYYEGEEVVSVSESAFEGASIRFVEIGANVRSVGNKAFSGSSLHSVTVPATVETVGESVFYHCVSLTSVVIENGVLGAAMFGNCTALEKVTFSSQVFAIPNSCFAGCAALESIALPASLEAIYPYAFAACTSLKTVYFPSSLKSIGSYAFAYIGEIAYPYYSGDWTKVEKSANWNVGTRFGDISDG